MSSCVGVVWGSVNTTLRASTEARADGGQENHQVKLTPAAWAHTHQAAAEELRQVVNLTPGP